ncbi:MAG: hypothetical protein LBR26_13280 [Prevotella sp.]|jgi:hypothetical protein|nr:hypothetical protein [Prevotella sp.]
MNRELANAVETYLVYLKNHRDTKVFKQAERKLISVLETSDPEDITEMFRDLNDYWDSLEAGK